MRKMNLPFTCGFRAESNFSDGETRKGYATTPKETFEISQNGTPYPSNNKYSVMLKEGGVNNAI